MFLCEKNGVCVCLVALTEGENERKRERERERERERGGGREKGGRESNCVRNDMTVAVMRKYFCFSLFLLFLRQLEKTIMTENFKN